MIGMRFNKRERETDRQAGRQTDRQIERGRNRKLVLYGPT